MCSSLRWVMVLYCSDLLRIIRIMAFAHSYVMDAPVLYYVNFLFIRVSLIIVRFGVCLDSTISIKNQNVEMHIE